MDFSTFMAVKKNFDRSAERNYAPVPVPLLAEVARMGLSITTYYEGAPSYPSPELQTIRRFDFYCLCHLIEGDGFFRDPGRGIEIELEPGQGMLLSPGYPHRYGARKCFVEDSVCFVGPVADSLYRAGLIRDGICFIGKERRLLPIIEALRQRTLAGQFEAGARLLTLLLELRSVDSAGEADAHHRIEQLLGEMQRSQRTWSAAEMAEYCNWSDSYFRKLFREVTGMTPKGYLDQLLLERAVERLSGGDEKISEVALRLGFTDPYYFSRRFRELTGYSPGGYRKLLRVNSTRADDPR